MNTFKVYYLGVGSATPSLRHQPSSQIIDFRGRLFMIDCGEGAQLGMRKSKLKFSRLEHIFISHLHGDHFFGLPGLLSTMGLHDIGGSLTVHMPPQGVEWLKTTMREFCPRLSFDLIIEPLCMTRMETVLEEDSLTVTSFPLNHRVPCVGFKFCSAPGLRHIRKDMIDWLNIPVKEIMPIKMGADYVNKDGRVFTNDMLTTPGQPSASYAYCSDTRFDINTAKYITPVDVVYHEATYLEAERAKAEERFHSTAVDAVRIAAQAHAKMLIMGHYSKSYLDMSGHLSEAEAEARRIDPGLEVIAADEGMTVEI